MKKPVASLPPIAAARAHWTIYLPSLVVGLVWAAVYAYAEWRVPPLGGLGALALAVLALGVPLLLFSAALRARILIVEVRPARTGGEVPELYARSGFARPREAWIGAQEIASVRLSHSLPQRLFGGGALDVRTLSGESLWLTDLDHPDAVAAALAPAPQPNFGHMEKLG